ncbi:MAG: hypothetical protein HFJ12_04395 [Bacilli bacterium]|nr:hypothetical protein [Bacilli bacterium]
MDEYIYYNNLYDCYQKLLTEKQRNYFEDYYFSNLSLGEISENYHISRNAIYKQLQITKKKLTEYEQKLKLYEKKEKITNLVGKVSDRELKNKLEELI